MNGFRCLKHSWSIKYLWKKIKQTSLCLCESKAFIFDSRYMASRNNATFKDIKEAMMEEFCGEDYKQTLETRPWTINFTRGWDMPRSAWNQKSWLRGWIVFEMINL